MAKTAMTLKEVIDIETFDPMNIDISEFQKLSDSMPIESSLNLAVAETLASVYLRSADRCSEIHSALLLHTQKVELEKVTIRQKLYLLAKDAGYKTVEDRKAYAESHDDYIVASDAVIKAKTVKKWFEDKHKWMLKAHQYMKDKVKAERQHQNSSGFSETAGVVKDGTFGEKEWD